MRISNITIGADPELFVIDEQTGKVVSSVGLIPGEKGNPYCSNDMPKGFGLETDNILAEFNIPPVKSKEGFVNNIEYMKSYINSFVKEKNKNYGIKCSASEIVDAGQLKSKQAKEFGCDIDYNVYTENANPKPKGERTNLRSAGFHIHVGYKDNNIDTSLRLIKYLDAYLGIPSVIRDTDTRRRTLYGKAGCFRLTEYGIEYRVLSSAMMKDVETLEFVWNQIQKAIAACNSGSALPSYAETVSAINDSNIELAKKLIQSYKLIDPVKNDNYLDDIDI